MVTNQAQSLLNRFISANCTDEAPPSVLIRRVSAVIPVATRQLPLEVLASAELEACIDCTGGATDKSKYEFLQLLPEVYFAVTKISARDTSNVRVGSFTYDG